MELKIISDPCKGFKICPTIYSSDRGTIVVQGKKLVEGEREAIGIPKDEDVVEIPIEILKSVNLSNL